MNILIIILLLPNYTFSQIEYNEEISGLVRDSDTQKGINNVTVIFFIGKSRYIANTINNGIFIRKVLKDDFNSYKGGVIEIEARHNDYLPTKDYVSLAKPIIIELKSKKNYGVMKGYVVDENTKKGIKDVKVGLFGKIKYFVSTDSKGIFIITIPKKDFMNIIENAYKIVAIHKYYEPSKLNFGPTTQNGSSEIPIMSQDIKISMKRKNEINHEMQCFLSPFPFAYENYSNKHAGYRKIFAGVGTLAIGSAIYSYIRNQNALNKYEDRKNRKIYDGTTRDYRDEASKWHTINRISCGIYGVYVIHNLVDTLLDYMSKESHAFKLNKAYFYVSNDNHFMKLNLIYKF